MGRGKPTEERAKRGFRIQWTIVAITLGLMTAAGGAGLLASPFLEVTNKYENDWAALALLASGLFTANMARMLQIWAKLKPVIGTPSGKRTVAQRAVSQRGFRELFIYAFALLGGLTTFTFVSAQPGLLPWNSLGLSGSSVADANALHAGLLLVALAFSLVPLLTGFYLLASAEEKAFQRKVWRDDVISTPSFWVSFSIIGLIIALAGWATTVSGSGSNRVGDDLTLFVTLGVIALFVAFIFLPHLVRWIERSGSNSSAPGGTRQMGFNPVAIPAQMASYTDSLLVRLVAPLTGATQKGPGIPHSFVLMSLIPLTALGFILAPPYGLMPIGLGMIMVMGLGRRWAWIEEDRETASRLLKTESPEIQVGFDNDLKDEALLGYASLFLLVPLALHQINGWQTDAFLIDSAREGNPFFAWLKFFGAELAKAVPFVDWWEIYQVDLSPPIEATDKPLGKHLTFAARAMVDLVIMAALFQAVAIWQRSRAQKKLYKIGHVNHFEPFAEREFFQTAFLGNGKKATPKQEFLEEIEKHITARENLRLPREPYNPARLADLLNSDSYEVRRTALWMVHEYKLLTGSLPEQIRQLVNHWNGLSFPQLSASNVPKERKRLLDEKRKFEQLISEIMVELEHGVKVIKLDETGLLLGLVENIRQVPEMSFSQIETLRLFGMLRNEYALLALAAHVLPPSETEWRLRIQNKFGRVPNLFLGQAPMRIKVYEALEAFGTNPPATPGIQRKTLKFLKLMAEIDGADPARNRAKRAADVVEEALLKSTPLETESAEDDESGGEE
jgi:hypothetical protein